jgi:hypothetical protein
MSLDFRRILVFRSVTRVSLCMTCALGAVAGCGLSFNLRPAPLFVTDVSIEGEPVGQAIIDTGGGYDLMLRDSFGLGIVDEVDVLVFGGRERVSLTEGFSFEAAGIPARADGAIVGLSLCDCNGVGFLFFRKTGVVLGLDFASGFASFGFEVPAGGITLPFAPPPPHMGLFDSSFMVVEVASGGQRQTVLGLIDTGTSITVIRRGLVGQASLLTPNRQKLTLFRSEFGSATVQAGLFDTDGLPDLIIGTDAMRLLADEWYFEYFPEGGRMVVFPGGSEGPATAKVTAAPWLILMTYTSSGIRSTLSHQVSRESG